MATLKESTLLLMSPVIILTLFSVSMRLKSVKSIQKITKSMKMVRVPHRFDHAH